MGVFLRLFFASWTAVDKEEVRGTPNRLEGFSITAGRSAHATPQPRW
jgi:hypothetical protein